MAADGHLDGRFRATRHADRAHITGRMGADVTDRIDHLGAEQRRRQPGIHGARHAVLADHQAIHGCSQRILQHLHRLDVIDTEHLPLGGPGRRTDRGGRGDVGIVGHLVHRHQFRLADRDRRGAEHAAVLRPTSPARGEHRAAADRGLDVLQPKNTPHHVSP